MADQGHRRLSSQRGCDERNRSSSGFAQRKHRYGKPLAIMVRDVDAARAILRLDDRQRKLCSQRPPARSFLPAPHARTMALRPSVAPGIPWLGVFLPYAPLQHLLFRDPRVQALVMTSANLSEEPIAIDNDEARARLGQHRRCVPDARSRNSAALRRLGCRVVDGAPQIDSPRPRICASRLDSSYRLDAPPLLAVGGHLKNVFTLARGRFAYQSQHLGDLENLTGLDFFHESLDHLMHTFEIEPEAVVHDLHPGYLSTNWAKDWAGEAQSATDRRAAPSRAHRRLHGGTRLAGPVIGLCLDGTGYGTDGRIWGGEVLIAHYDCFERFAHLQYVPMPGGEAAIREPWRMAFGALHATGFDLCDPVLIERLGVTKSQSSLLARMIQRNLNSPLTSSCGRLFDAAAAIILRQREVDYEAQAAIMLEGIAIDEPDDCGGYPVELAQSSHAPAILSTRQLWHELLADIRADVPASRIAARFHAGVAQGFIAAAVCAGKSTGIRQIALSGGCLHNRRLARLLRAGLESDGFEVFQQRRVSPGDGGLSYGQAAVAAAIMGRGKSGER